MLSNSTSILIGILLGFILFYLFSEIRNRCFISDSNYQMVNQIILTLVRQISRWSNAAIQDKTPIIEVLHANYGAGYLWALTDVFTTQQIQTATNMSNDEYMKFKDKIVGIQDNATKKLVKLCQPSMQGLDPELSRRAGEG